MSILISIAAILLSFVGGFAAAIVVSKAEYRFPVAQQRLEFERHGKLWRE